MSLRLRFAFSLLTVVISMSGTGNFARGTEPAWESVMSQVEIGKSAVSGTWQKTGDSLSVKGAPGARFALPVSPTGDYDFSATFTRHSGQHSVGLVVTQGGHQVVFEVDAWGRHLAGFQNLNGKSIQENRSRREGVQLENNRKYVLAVEVRKNELRGLLDGQEIAKITTDGTDLSVPDVWAMPASTHLGLVAWECDTTFHALEMRVFSGDRTVASAQSTRSTGTSEKSGTMKSSAGKQAGKSGSRIGAPATKAPPPGAKSVAKVDSSTVEKSRPAQKTQDSAASPAGKRVLIVIANHHFFYREYGDPRAELERAGIQVTVAAGRKAPCRPHDGSGQGPDGGVVQPDLALSDVRADDYDAVLFSGGWGASMYQFAFPGRYNDSAYNGDREIKGEANRIINDFLAQDKYTCALCNAVSVLAWARVNGKSPLAGKRICAPPRQAPPGIYNGRPGQPSCRWHPEANGVRMSPPGAVGQPGSAADDVLVDGRIITGEDDISAREMGRKLVEVLSK